LLVGLEELDIQENKNFQEFPVSFADLKNLKKINIMNTSLQDLPYEMQFWTNLVELNMKENTQIEKLPRMEALHIITHPFFCISLLTHLFRDRQTASIKKLKNLQKLDCSYGSLTALPEEIAELSNLTVLDLRKNSLTTYSIPPCIRNLRKLEKFTIA